MPTTGIFFDGCACVSASTAHTLSARATMILIAGIWPSVYKLLDAGDGEHPAHARRGELGVAQQARAVHQHELLGEMHDRARALLAADHPEVRLVAVEIGGEHHAGLVEARGRAEDVSREHEGRRQHLRVPVELAP